jgi:hypothetical protein
MIELHPLISYVSVILAVSSYLVLNKNLYKRKLYETKLLGTIEILKNNIESLEKRIGISTSEVIVDKQSLLPEEIVHLKKGLAENEGSISKNSITLYNMEGTITRCQKKIKSLEQGLSLVNSILESSASVVKPKGGFSLW